MDKIQVFDQYSVEKENSEQIESLSKLSDFWVKEDIKQGLGSTDDSEEFNVIND
jgi:hypothetical protein